MFIVALFAITKTKNNANVLSLMKTETNYGAPIQWNTAWQKRMKYTCNKIENSKCIILCKISQIKKAIYGLIPFI